jgi:hypothetical protein
MNWSKKTKRFVAKSPNRARRCANFSTRHTSDCTRRKRLRCAPDALPAKGATVSTKRKLPERRKKT